MTVLFIFFLVTVMGDNILRAPYGVLFEELTFLDNSASHWHHTFAVEYLEVPQFFADNLVCLSDGGQTYFVNDGLGTDIDLCEEFKDSLLQYERDRTLLVKRIDTYQRHLKDILSGTKTPTWTPFDMITNQTTPRRMKRGWFNLGGDVLKTVFGLATDRTGTTRESVHAHYNNSRVLPFCPMEKVFSLT